MFCEKPVAIKLPSGHDLVENPVTHEKYNGLYVPCGRCVLCKIAKTREWALRCVLELQYWDKAIFTTLTYDDEHINNDSLCKKDLQDFFKRLRKDLNKPIKYFACGEYGDKSGRKHLHMIIFGLGFGDYNDNLGCYYSENRVIEDNWNKGHVFNGSVTRESVQYVCGYIFKKYGSKVNKELYSDKGLEVPFQLQSSGIGKRWYYDYEDFLFSRGYIVLNGVKYSIPRYFINMMKSRDNERYLQAVNNHIFQSFDTEFRDYIAMLENGLSSRLDSSEFDKKELFALFSAQKDYQNSIRAKVEKHKQELFR